MEHESFIAVARGPRGGGRSSLVMREEIGVEIRDTASGSPLVRVTALLKNGIPWINIIAMDSSGGIRALHDGPLENVVYP